MATITRIIDTPSATPIDSGEYDVVTFSESGDAAGANTFAVQQAAQSASILVHGSGDTVMIEGLSAEYKISRSGKAITLKNVTSNQTITVSFADLIKGAATDAKLVFLDGELDLHKAAGKKAIFIGDQKVVKLAKAVVSTPDHSTAASEYFDDLTGAGGENAIARTYILTTASNTITAGFNNDVIEGVFGDATDTNNTFNLGDNIDAGDGDDVLNLIATGANPSSVAIILKGVETINVSDAVGSTINATQFSDNPTINFNNTVAGNTSTVTAASLGSDFGLNGEGNLTVNFASTSGASDDAHVAVNGAGSASNRSTIDVSDGNTIEKVTIHTSGTNFIALTAGDAAENVTVLGDGTNDIDLSTGVPDDVFTLDASLSTGTNTFALGEKFGTVDTIKGGTGDDTISATLNNGGMVVPTMTGVETADLTFGAVVGVNLQNTTGLHTINMYDVDGATNVINANSSLEAVNIIDPLSDDFDINLSYRDGQEGDLTLGLMVEDGEDAWDLGDVTVENAKSFTLDVQGYGEIDVEGGYIDVQDAVDSLNISIAASAGLDGLETEFRGAVGAINVSVGDEGYFSGYFHTGPDGRANIGDVTATALERGDVEVWIGQSGGFDIGNVSLNAIGRDSSAGLYMNTDEGGNIGNISVTAQGMSAYAELGAEASGGSIGNISVLVDGVAANAWLGVSAGDYEGSSSAGSPLTTIGNINVTVNGVDSEFSGFINMSGGSIGDVSVELNGTRANGNLYIDVVGEYRDIEGDGGVDDWVGGGNIGNVSFVVNGDDASGYLGIQSSGGNIGNITLTGNGLSADMLFNVSAHAKSYSGAPDFVEIGDVTVNALNGATVSGTIFADGGNIGDVTVNVEGRGSSGSLDLRAVWASGTIGLNSGYVGGGNIGDIDVTIDGGLRTEYEVHALASGGNVGDVTWHQTGVSTSGALDIDATFSGGGGLGGHGGKVGDISIVLGNSLNFDAFVQAEVSVGNISLTGGYDVSASVDISGGWATDTADTREIGDIDVAVGADSDIHFSVSGWGGDIGGVDISLGNGSNLDLYLEEVSGDIQYVTLTGGNKFASAYLEIDANSVGYVNAGTWAGETKIDLRGTTLGTDITTGTWKSLVYGTDAGDTIRLGTGSDTVVLDGNTETDTIYTFAAAKDVLDVNDATSLETLLSANATNVLVNGDIQRLVDISGGEDITTVAGLQAALDVGGEYVGVDVTASNTAVIITAASSSATKFYVFEINNDGTDAVAASEITLVGIVNGSTIGNLTLANFE